MSSVSPRAVVQSYYDAMNVHDVETMTQCCSEDIEVTFPDSSRNWSGQTVAREKFKGMFETLKNFAAEWRFEDNVDKGNAERCDADTGKEILPEVSNSVVNVVAHFTAKGYDAHRKMIYTISEGSIRRIDHVDI